MKKKQKSKGHIALWAILILSLAIAEYYLINKYVTEDSIGKVIEDRTLTTNEQEFFKDKFLSNPGFLRNFYDTPKNLSIPMILEVGQGNDKIKILTNEEKQNIIETDFKNTGNYSYLYANPETAFNIILDGSLLRTMYNDLTNDKYSNSAKADHYVYNHEYDVYYNAVSYDNTGSYANHYSLSNIKITDNSVYQITYTAYYVPDLNNLNYKETLYRGVVTLKKEKGDKYYFVSNIVNEHLVHINYMKNFENKYNFNTIIATKTKTMDKTYYGGEAKRKVTLSKYKAIDPLNNNYVVKVVPNEVSLYDEVYSFDENNNLIMYIKKTPEKLATYYSFTNGVLEAKYEQLPNEKFNFKAFTKEIKEEGKDILNKVKEINILD